MHKSRWIHYADLRRSLQQCEGTRGLSAPFLVAAQSRCGSEPAQRFLGLRYSAPAKAPVVRLNRCAARTWQVDPFVKGPLGLLVHDFGARTQPPIAVVEFEAVSAAAYFELVGSWICLRPPTRIPHYVTISVFSAAFLAIRCAARKASLSSRSLSTSAGPRSASTAKKMKPHGTSSKRH